ncbi:MAG TPA: MerR family transcriptional regulator [Firmicutes bacterium]|nr:MerR family transcriptional regulator [Bacillota bacterium]
MEYTIQKLARMAGVSTRTLRYYDEMGLLAPARLSSSGYRIYGAKEVDTLQQILFFRELGLELSAIGRMIHDPSFSRLEAFEGHLRMLEEERARLDLLIRNVQRTIQEEKGDCPMKDAEKFEGLKRRLVAENEEQYGQEIREKYGNDAVDQSNAKMMNLSQEDYDAMQETAARILADLQAAVQAGLDPASEAGRELAARHKEWLHYTWPRYSAEAHKGLVQMYLDDPRFTAYYDKEVPGCARFLRDAVHAWADRL